MRENENRPDWDNETPLALVDAFDYIPPHYRWVRTGQTTLVIHIQDQEHRTAWTVEPDIDGMWNLDDSGGVPLELIDPDHTEQPYTSPGRAMDVAQRYADELLRIWDQEIEGRIIEKRTKLLDIELSFRGLPTEIEEKP